jgi:regulator of nucleoside diphosphate kinase
VFGVDFRRRILSNYNELLVSASDAEVLVSVVADRARSSSLEAEAANALADVLMGARMVPHENLPADRVAMNSVVRYREEPGGARRTVAVVHPMDADAAKGRISVLSPVGRALLGRKPGAVIAACVPGGRGLKLHILGVEKASEAFASDPEEAS